jgi:hypothetical protein
LFDTRKQIGQERLQQHIENKYRLQQELQINCKTGKPFNADKPSLSTGCARNGVAYNWTLYSYFQAPFAMTIGALNAIGIGSKSTYCARYTTSSLNYLNMAFEKDPEIKWLDRFTNLHEAILIWDNIAYSCYTSFSTEISVDHFIYIYNNPKQILVNLSYNIGQMYGDVINYLYYDWTTVQNNNWAYFVFYLIGDFLMRFFFNPTDSGLNTFIG